MDLFFDVNLSSYEPHNELFREFSNVLYDYELKDVALSLPQYSLEKMTLGKVFRVISNSRSIVKVYKHNYFDNIKDIEFSDIQDVPSDHSHVIFKRQQSINVKKKLDSKRRHLMKKFGRVDKQEMEYTRKQLEERAKEKLPYFFVFFLTG